MGEIEANYLKNTSGSWNRASPMRIRYLTNGTNRDLVMKCKIFDPLDDISRICRVVEVIAYLASIPSERVGSLGAGITRDLLCTDYE